MLQWVDHPPNYKGESAIKLVDEAFFASGAGKIAIVSSPPQGLSREDDKYKNSVFSHFLIKGLAGDAAEENGEVTIDSLLTYIRRESPPDQPIGRYGQDYGRLILSRSYLFQKEHRFQKSYPDFEISKDNLYKQNFSPLRNILEPFQDPIRNLVDSFSDKTRNNNDIANGFLDAIRLSSGAEAILLLRKDSEDWIVKSISVDSNSSISIENCISIALSASLRNHILGLEINGVFGKITIDNCELSIVTISLRKKEPYEILVICNSNNEIIENEIYGQIITAIYNATNSFSSMRDADWIEAAVLDYLKVLHKFVPVSIYNRRYELFKKRLLGKNISVVFQPVYKFGINEISICGYEALAYDIAAENSPSDLFDTAEIWGKRFMLEADLHFLHTAAYKYQELRDKTPGCRRPEDCQDLSINVYPDSLLRTKYFEEMRYILKEGIIPNDKLLLELSEKTTYPIMEGEGLAAKHEINNFRQLLEEYVHSFGIGFAIDDFGIGYSSVSRLAELHPSYIKIDREILLLKNASDTIKFIISFVNDLTSKQFLRNSKIVFEGYDSEASQLIHLGELRRIGIQYIQGYIVGKPIYDKLSRLDNASKDYLFSLINSPNGVRNGS